MLDMLTIADALAAQYADKPKVMQLLSIAEETGELLGAYRRFSRHSRRQGTWTEVELELADVIIAAYVAANLLDIDIEHAISQKLDIIDQRNRAK